MRKLLSIVIFHTGSDEELIRCLSSLSSELTGEVQCIVRYDGVLSPAIRHRGSSLIPGLCFSSSSSDGALCHKRLSALAAGEYVWFIDSLGCVSKGFLELFKQSIHSGIDIYAFGSSLSAQDRDVTVPFSAYDARILSSLSEKGAFRLEEHPEVIELSHLIWNKIYRLRFLIENRLVPDELSQAHALQLHLACLTARSATVRGIATAAFNRQFDGDLSAAKQAILFQKMPRNVMDYFQDFELAFLKAMRPHRIYAHYYRLKFAILARLYLTQHGDEKKALQLALFNQIDTIHQDYYDAFMGAGPLPPAVKSVFDEKDSYLASIIEPQAILLSIVIPIYNIRNYISRCLESVFRQNLPVDCYEVILVDDRSTDGTYEVALEFAAQHSNVRVIQLPEHSPGGAGIPTNVGIKAARGKYLALIDGDDHIGQDMFAELLSSAERNDSDLVLCSFTCVSDEDGSVSRGYDFKRWNKLFTRRFASLTFDQKKAYYFLLAVVPWRKLYRRSFMVENNILYPEGDLMYEDNCLHWFSIAAARKISLVRRSLAAYTVEREGQTMQQFCTRYMALCTHAETIKQHLLDKNLYEKYRFYYYAWIAKQIRWALRRLPQNDFAVFLPHMAWLASDFSFSEIVRFQRQVPQKLSTAVSNYFLLRNKPKPAIYSAKVTAGAVFLYKGFCSLFELGKITFQNMRYGTARVGALLTNRKLNL